jgi:hypothetical protein
MPDEPPERWEVAAVGPAWEPAPGEDFVRPVAGSLEVHGDALVFRPAAGGEAQVIPASGIRAIGPLTPGTPMVGGWMPKWQRRLRSPGFAVDTEAGAWVFDGPHGPKRADALSRRFGIA